MKTSKTLSDFESEVFGYYEQLVKGKSDEMASAKEDDKDFDWFCPI
ncbi:MAG: hypothetical protein NT175_01005 [Bacteroidetes bacterium]|nr:hypothetical protein [Bacteroidota bacterium]